MAEPERSPKGRALPPETPPRFIEDTSAKDPDPLDLASLPDPDASVFEEIAAARAARERGEGEEPNDPASTEAKLGTMEQELLADEKLREKAEADAQALADAQAGGEAPPAQAKPAEPATPAAASTSTAQPPAQAQPPVVLPVWNSFDDIRPAELDPAVRPIVERVQALAREQVASVEAAVAAERTTSRAREEAFDKLIGEIEDAGVPTAAPLAQRLKTTMGEREELAKELLNITYDAFLREHPDYAKAPPELRTQLDHIITSGGLALHEPPKGRPELLGRLAEAWKFVCYKGGYSPAPVAAAPKPTATAPAARPAPPASNAQAVVLSSSRAPAGRSSPAPAKEMQMRDILDENEHLLGDFRPY